MKEKQGFSRDFILVLLGQIISLFGNAVMRFALPLHLLNVTGSPKLLGIVSGFAFLPLAVMSPIGGLIADRVNKRSIMVALDFFTSALVLIFTILHGKVNLVTLILVMLFMLYGISGAYQPSVQSSIPLLVAPEKVMAGNAAINIVSSLSSLLGPALGGIAYSMWGIMPILYTCIGCFFVSAVMEIFIRIPMIEREAGGSILSEVKNDLKESLSFIVKRKPAIGKLTLCCAGINLFLSALIVIGLPVVVMQILKLPADRANELYGYLQAALAVGGLTGGMLAGVLSGKLDIRKSYKIFFACTVLLLPMGAALTKGIPPYLAYGILLFSSFLLMICSSLYTIQVMSYIQIVTPKELIGKVIAWILGISTCAQPAGQIIYGFLFEALQSHAEWIFYGAAFVSVGVAFFNRRICSEIETVGEVYAADVPQNG